MRLCLNFLRNINKEKNYLNRKKVSICCSNNNENINYLVESNNKYEYELNNNNNKFVLKYFKLFK